MRNDKRTKILALTIAFVALVTSAPGQDLGSANKLFGAGSKKRPPTARPKTANQQRTAKKPVAKAPSKTAGKSTKTGAKPAATATKVKTPPAKSKVTPKADSTAKKPVAKPLENRIKPTPKTNSIADSVAEELRFKTFGSNTVKTTSMPTAPRASAASDARYEDLIGDGNAARDDRDYATAENAYLSAKGIKPRDPRAVYGLGNLYSDQQRWEEAETAYRAALKLDSTDAFAHIALSYVLTQPIATPDLSDRYAEAERLGRRAIQLDSRNALAYDQLGAAMELRGLIGAETESAYRKAVNLDDSFAPAYAHLGRLLRRRGQSAESAKMYEKAISLALDVPTTILVAEVMQSEQRYAASEPLLRTAVSGDPKNPAALLLLGRALTAQEKYSEAEQTLRKAALVSPNAFMPNSLLGSLYWRQGKYEQAETALMQAVRYVAPLEKRQLAFQFQQIGDGYKKAGRAQNADRAYRQAKALENESRVADANQNKDQAD